MKSKKIMLEMYAAMFWAAFGYIIYSSLVSTFITKYGLTIAQTGLIGSCISAGQMAVQFFCNPLSKRFNKLQMVLIGVCTSILAFLIIVVTNAYPLLLFALFIDGASVSMLNVVICAYISDLYAEKRSSYLNLFHGVYGMGSMLGPVLPTVLLASGLRWEYGYIAVIAVGLLLVMALFGERKSEYCGGKTDTDAVPFFILFKNPRIVRICFCTMLCVGFDIVVGTYMATYFEFQLNAVALAGLSVSFYWMGSAVGRFLYPIFFARFNPKKFLITVNILTAGCLLVGMLLQNPAIMFCMVLLSGMFAGMNYPMEIGFACEEYPENSISATNAACFSASVGGVIASLIAGKVIAVAGYQGMIVQCIVMICCIAVLLATLLEKNK